jgi:hypothetical protein
VIASRNSATFLPENSIRDCAAAAGAVAAAAVLRAPFAAVCCLPRALPPALAARLRAGVLADELRELEDEPRLLVDELLPLARDAVDLRAVELALRAVELALRAVEPDPLRDRDPLDPDDDFRVDDFRVDDPPPLPLPDSAIALLL